MITSYKSKIYYLLKNNSNLLSDGIALDISKKTCNFKHDKLKIFRILKVLNLLENKVLASQESFKGLNSTVMGKNTFISFTQIIYNGINPNIFFLKKYSWLSFTLKKSKKFDFFDFFRVNRYYRINSKNQKYFLIKPDLFSKERSMYDTFFINSYTYRTYLNRLYSIGNWYNRNIKFFFHLTEKNFEFQKKAHTHIVRYGEVFGKKKLAFVNENFSLIYFFCNSLYFYKLFLLLFFKLSNRYPFLVQIFFRYLSIVENKKRFELKKTSPFFNFKSFVSHEPYKYRSLKYGRKFYLNFFKNITFAKVVFFQIKKHNFSKSNVFKNEERFTSLVTTKTNLNTIFFFGKNYLEWYSTIANKYKYHSYIKNTKVYPQKKASEFFSLWRSMEYRRFYHLVDKRKVPSYLSMLPNFNKFYDSFFSKIQK